MSERSAEGSLLVFADDWGRHPSSCQYLVRELCDQYDVLWVNTIGMRPPRLDRYTLQRAVGKLRQWRSRGKTRGRDARIPDNITVTSPLMWPWFTRRHDRRINRWLLTKSLARLVESMARPVTGLTTIPIVADLVGELPVERWVYYCVDDFGSWPGLDQVTMDRMERDLVGRVDAIVAASEALQSRIRDLGREAQLLTHGVDIEFWQVPRENAVPAQVAGLAKPWYVFWGVVDRRLDIAAVRELAERIERGTVILVGPQQDPPAELNGLPHLVMPGPVDVSKLPAVAAEASVLLMPYQNCDVTRAMQPLKLKEYLATGKPVVTTDLPATRPWADCLDIARGPAHFADLAISRGRSEFPSKQMQARTRLTNESWHAKAEQFVTMFTSARRHAVPDGRREALVSEGSCD